MFVRGFIIAFLVLWLWSKTSWMQPARGGPLQFLFDLPKQFFDWLGI